MDYVFGRIVLAFLGLVSASLLVVGVIIAISAAGGAGYSLRQSYGVAIPASILAAIPGMIIALVGLVLLAMVDHYMATLDSATATKKMLRVAEDQLKVSRQALKIGVLSVPGYAEMAPDEQGRLLGNGKTSRNGFFGLFTKSGRGSRTSTAASSQSDRGKNSREKLNGTVASDSAIGQKDEATSGFRQVDRSEPILSNPKQPETVPLERRADNSGDV
ncbi:hypothetical protein [Pseudohalocynthiibacter sp. F2068]|uniref:hypothetical protein n=1 Tax=Pseudohalocynthiibacter sp. F2068 TaxID=2926418 RepID=UPI001FF6C607|nr:hypothetical protein [Pseudohalocynthiibacter sp. F2068]MCK0103221.1 hypothetical protein [Pseudohalocynthiibacter sp. F2068]